MAVVPSSMVGVVRDRGTNVVDPRLVASTSIGAKDSDSEEADGRIGSVEGPKFSFEVLVERGDGFF